MIAYAASLRADAGHANDLAEDIDPNLRLAV
jgi:hypothetical protein